ncbi:MAG: efflux RND transporter periplasmic adaptor subunit [Gorillibacterium sp.]|nr:efflux RND transporter periplasmic adaptor subunit [Gorillibacterium sp.]
MDKLLLHAKSIAVLAAALVLGSALSGCSLLPKEEAALKPPLIKPAQENYRTVIAEKGTITKEIKGNGNFVSLSTDVAQFTGQGGRIDKITVSSGDKVKKGDVLVQLILDGMDIQLKEQELALQRAKYAYKLTSTADKDAVKIASLQLDIEQIKYDRLKGQFESKSLKSNIDGEVIFTETLQEGDYIEPYQTLVVVADPTKLQLSLSIDTSNDFTNVDVGSPAEVKIKDVTVEAKVVQTPNSAPSTLNKELAERNSKTLYLKVLNPPAGVEIGTIADVRIITQKRDNVIKIPRNGLRNYLGRNFVRVLEEGTRLRELDVEVGINGSTEVEISKGLEEGQVIVLQ